MESCSVVALLPVAGVVYLPVDVVVPVVVDVVVPVVVVVVVVVVVPVCSCYCFREHCYKFFVEHLGSWFDM